MITKKQKHIICLFFIASTLFSCRTKKTFNGTAGLDCPSYENTTNAKKETKSTKYKLILLKDGKRVGGKSKRGKSKLFKDKTLR